MQHRVLALSSIALDWPARYLAVHTGAPIAVSLPRGTVSVDCAVGEARLLTITLLESC